LFEKIIQIGIHDGLSFKEKGKLRIFNTSCLTVSFILILYSIMSYMQNRYFAATSTMFELIVLCFVFFLNSIKKYILAFHVGFSSAFVFIFFFTLLFGENTQSHIFFLFIPVATLIVFENKKTILTYFVFSMMLLTASIIIFKYHEPYFGNNEADEIFGLLNFLFTGLLIFLGVSLFKKENNEFNHKIDQQKKMLEEKNKDITDSITYAKRIQKALLASDSVLTKNLPQHFVLYKPKDIVSGDFYWAEKIDDKFLLATCDCTGHGVPGAFMSLLGISFLNEITKEKKIIRPDLIFNALRKNIIKALNPDENQTTGKDGMDAVLCSFDFSNMKLEFACANNPIWILRNNEWLEFAADKFPIGMYIHESPFNLQEIQLQKGDLIYTFTDGYADQFGGSKGKKLKNKSFKQLLQKIASQELVSQKESIEEHIDDWKGSLEQVDDILVIGIRI